MLCSLALSRLFLVAIQIWDLRSGILSRATWFYAFKSLYRTMADRHTSSIKFMSRRSLSFFFLMISILFVLSWFFVLRSTGRTQFAGLPNPKLFSSADDADSLAQIQRTETSSGSRTCATTDKSVLKVFMYDLPPEFHFRLLDWKPKGSSFWPDITTQIPEYPGGLNLQHSIEYWLTLDLLASELPKPSHGGAAIRVHNSSEADIIFAPFFSSLSYNRFAKTKKPQKEKNLNNVLQDKLVKFLTAQKEWKRSGGRDHLILAHHPNSMLEARKQLWPATFILADFGRYPPNVANVQKDVIAPYKHLVESYVNDSSEFDSRPTLLYFQGAIYRKDGGLARQEIFYLLKDEKDVHFSFGSVQKGGIQKATEGMHASKFCLNIAGDTPSSNRLFDAIAAHCVPVIISDEIELPYEDVLDYSEFCIFVRTRDALRENFLINFIRSIGKQEWTRMWNKLKEVAHFFEYQFPSREGDAVQMIWQAVARKVPALKLKLHWSKRFARSPSSTDNGLKSIPAPRNFG